MSVFHLKSTGSKTGTGASTAADWTDANCYGTWANVMAAIVGGGASGDSVIVDDEIFVASANAALGININGTITITSRSGDPLLSGIKSSSATGALLLSNSTTHSCAINWVGLTLGKTVPHTDTSRPVIHHMSQRTGNVSFTDCRFTDIDMAIASGSNWYFGLATNDAAAGYGTKLTFDSCVFSDITGTYAQNGVLFAYTTGSPKQIITNDITIEDITASDASGGFVTSQGARQIAKDVTLDGWSGRATGAQNCGHVFKHITNATGAFFHGRRLTFKNVHSTSEVVQPMIDVTCRFDVRDVLGISVTAESTTKTVGQAAVFMAFNATAQGVLRNIRGYDCHANYGTLAYWSNGAGGICENAYAEECSVGTGILYKGGGGDLTLRNALVRNCSQRVETDLTVQGLAFYGHIHASTGDHDAVVALDNVVAVDNTYETATYASGNPAIMFNNPNATYTLQGYAKNCVVRDNALGILMDGAAVNLTATGNNLLGGSDGFSESQTAGTLTETGTTDTAVTAYGQLSLTSTLSDRWPSVV